MKQKIFGLLTLIALLTAFSSCESHEINILQLRWGLVDEGVPSAGTSDLNYVALKEAYDAVDDACKKCGGVNYIASSTKGECSINLVEKREVEKKIEYIKADSKSAIEGAQLSKLWKNRTFRIEYRFGNSGDWTQAYEYVYPESK